MKTEVPVNFDLFVTVIQIIRFAMSAEVWIPLQMKIFSYTIIMRYFNFIKFVHLKLFLVWHASGNVSTENRLEFCDLTGHARLAKFMSLWVCYFVLFSDIFFFYWEFKVMILIKSIPKHWLPDWWQLHILSVQ